MSERETGDGRGSAGDSAAAARAAAEAQHELFVAQMRARFELDQAEAAMEKK